MSIRDTDAEFEVICKRCGKRYWVIRNFGGGIRMRSNQSINPAICTCGSRQLEVY